MKNLKYAVFIIAILLSVIAFYIGSKVVAINTSGTAYSDSIAAVLASVLTDLTNSDRGVNNVNKLKENPLLVKAAELKAEDMIKNGYFAHNSPEGLTPWHWLNKAGYKFLVAGENLAIKFTESEDVEKAWLNSPTHKKNIMDSRFTEVGIATKTGMYKGKETTFVVQFFGKPKDTSADVYSALK